MFKAILSVLAICALAACGSKEVSFDTLETARAQAVENSLFNARSWRAQAPAYAKLGIKSRGDSSQNPACPQGDGWSSIDLIDDQTGAVRVKLKCSTVSANVGCRESEDFKGSPYASEDGNCQPTTKVPHPLPKIVK